MIIGTVKDAVASGKITSHKLDGITVRRRQTEPAEIIPVTREQLQDIALGMHPGLDGGYLSLTSGTTSLRSR